jgi:hypothetical protein
MAFEIEFVENAIAELGQLKAFLKTKIIREVEKQLVHQPVKPSKNKKCLISAFPQFVFEPLCGSYVLANTGCFTTWTKKRKRSLSGRFAAKNRTNELRTFSNEGSID